MDDKKKLIDLIKDGRQCPDDGSPFDEERCAQCRYRDDIDCDLIRLADYLIANGVVIRKQGEWIRQDETYTRFQCSRCLSENHHGYGNYCPNCGAFMGKGE